MLRKKLCAKLRTIIDESRHDEFMWYNEMMFIEDWRDKRYAERRSIKMWRKRFILTKILNLIDYRNV